MVKGGGQKGRRQRGAAGDIPHVIRPGLVWPGPAGADWLSTGSLETARRLIRLGVDAGRKDRGGMTAEQVG